MTPGDDLCARLELVDEALDALAGNIAHGRVPSDEPGRDRCRRVAESIASNGRRVLDLLGRPPPGPGLDAILRDAAHREQGEEP